MRDSNSLLMFTFFEDAQMLLYNTLRCTNSKRLALQSTEVTSATIFCNSPINLRAKQFRLHRYVHIVHTVCLLRWL